MSLRLVLVVLSVVLLAQGPCDGGIILDKISSLVNRFVPLQRPTTTALPPTASTSSGGAVGTGDNVSSAVSPCAAPFAVENSTEGAGNHSASSTASPSGSESAVDNSTLSVTSLPDDLTTTSSNNSLPKGMIFAPNLAKCSSGFRPGKNGRCYKIV